MRRRHASAPRTAGPRRASRRRHLSLRHPHPPHRLLERKDGRTQRSGRFGRRAIGAEGSPQSLHGARVQLGDARLVDPDRRPDLLHRRFRVVVHRDHFALAGGQRRRSRLGRARGLRGFRRPCPAQRARTARAPAAATTPSTCSAADSGDVCSIVLIRTIVRPRRASSDPDPGGEVGERRLGAELATELLARRLDLPALTTNAARPGVPAQRVDHRAADPPLREGLELDPARLVEAAGGIDQPQHPVLHQIVQLDRVRHRRRDTTCKGFDEWQARGNPVTLAGDEGLALHGQCPLNVPATRRERTSPSATVIPSRKRRNSVSRPPDQAIR